MKKITFLTIALLITVGVSEISAQFPIKIPTFGKPKAEKPKPDQTPINQPKPDDGANQNPSKKSGGDDVYMEKPRPTSVPVLLKNSFNVKAATVNSYWKTPNEQNHTSWIPRVSFDLFYDQSETVRYTMEWFDPKGVLWYSEALDGTKSNTIGDAFDTKATDAVGTFGFRLLDTKTKEIIFQGKFNVKKILLDPSSPRYKNQAMFYVENDWSLPIGYVGFSNDTTWDLDPYPTVYIWFKGDLTQKDFEARLFHNNQQVTSTDDGGQITNGSSLFAEERNAENCFQQTEVCRYLLWGFTWKKFRVRNCDSSKSCAHLDPNAIYTKDKPGEYTVKIFHKGVQVRETKFSIQPNGWLETNKFAAQIPMENYRAVIPVKVIGTLDKWNASAWKTDAFYGNPLNGFVTP